MPGSPTWQPCRSPPRTQTSRPCTGSRSRTRRRSQSLSRCRASTGTDLTKKPPKNNNNNKRGVEKEDKKRDQQVRSIASTHQHAINIATEKSMTHGARVRGGPELKQLVSEGVKPKSSLPSTEPPWHEPTSPQLRTCWTARLMSMPLAFRAILTRSPSAEMAPCAQHEPQSKVGGDAGFGSGKQFIPRGEWGKKGGKITRRRKVRISYTAGCAGCATWCSS